MVSVWIYDHAQEYREGIVAVVSATGLEPKAHVEVIDIACLRRKVALESTSGDDRNAQLEALPIGGPLWSTNYSECLLEPKEAAVVLLHTGNRWAEQLEAAIALDVPCVLFAGGGKDDRPGWATRVARARDDRWLVSRTVVEDRFAQLLGRWKLSGFERKSFPWWILDDPAEAPGALASVLDCIRRANGVAELVALVGADDPRVCTVVESLRLHLQTLSHRPLDVIRPPTGHNTYSPRWQQFCIELEQQLVSESGEERAILTFMSAVGSESFDGTGLKVIAPNFRREYEELERFLCG